MQEHFHSVLGKASPHEPQLSELIKIRTGHIVNILGHRHLTVKDHAILRKLTVGAMIIPSCKCNGVTLIRDSCFLELNQINCVLSGLF